MGGVEGDGGVMLGDWVDQSTRSDIIKLGIIIELLG